MSTDVGTVGLAGSAANSAGTWTIRGSGADIWGANDAFQFLHRPANRSGFIVARIASLQTANAFGKAGVMLRAGVDANAATAILDVKPDGGIEFMTRDGATFTATVFTTAPSDGSTIGSVTVPMADPIAGFAVTSHDANRTTTAVFDNPAR
jgi:hypothetical protein